MRPGDVIAQRFVIERLAGAGAMGSVYRAVDRHTGEAVAVKTLHRQDKGGVRFAREARALAELAHPGIVRYVAHGTTGAGSGYLAIEWLEGVDLAARLERGPLHVRDSVALSARVAGALGAAHARGIVHRDVKPSNLFLPGDDIARVKVLDFGVARMDGSMSATRTGAVIGTPAYMAPEQARGEREIDARADVFALGCVLFECLTGRPPFVAEHVMAVLAKVLLEEAPRAGELSREVPPDLDDLLARMLSKERERRPPDGAAVALELDRLEPLAGRAAAAPSALSSALTARERRLLCLVLAKTTGGLRLGRAGAPGRPPVGSLGMGIRLGVTLGVGAPGRPPLGSAPSLEELTGSDLRAATATGAAGPPSWRDGPPTARAGAAAGEELPPDDSHIRAAVAPFGARVEWLMDGSMIATLSGKGSATDQAAQAALCALALRPLLPEAPIALAMGRGAVTDRFPVGEVIDRAARLLPGVEADDEGAPPPPGTPAGELPVRLDEVTAGLLDARFDVRGDASGLWLRGEREVVAAGRTVLGKPVACVGREREIGVLLGLFEESVSEPIARAVLITASAGVGKSRVRAELLRKLDERGERVEVLMSAGDPMSAGSPFAMLAPALRRAAGMRDGEPLAVRRQKLRARLGRNLEADDLTRVAEFLGEMVNAPFPDEDSVQLRAARQDPVLMGDQMRRAFEDFLAAECAEQPVVIVLENLHWGDLPSVRFIDAALRNLDDRPLLVLALARPEVRESFPRLWEERGLHEIRLPELTRKASERLVREILGDDIGAPQVARVVAQAAGNAFYLEELIRAVASGKGDRLPETVVAMVEARLEAIDPEARRVLRAASVFGQVFWLRGAAALLGERSGHAELADWLTVLERLEIVARRGEGKFPGEPEYAFRSLLLREAAYAMLTDADRTLGHRLAGAWLEAAGESDALVLGEHFERGGEPHHAIAWYRNAAEQAIEASDLGGAIACAERGVACGAEGHDLGALLLLKAEAMRWRGDNIEAEQCALEAMRWLPRGSPLWCATAGELGTVSGQLGHIDSIVALAESFLAPGAPDPRGGVQAIAYCRLAVQLLYAGRYEVARALIARVEEAEARGTPRDPVALGRIHQARSVSALFADDPVAHLRWTEHAAASFERAGDMRNACMQRVNVGNACMQLGVYEDAERPLREALAAAERMGMIFIATVARHNLGFALAGRGALDEAIAVERMAVEEALAQDDRRLRAGSQVYLAILLTTAGRHSEAERAACAALEVGAPMAPLVAYANGVLARTLLAQGRTAEAMAAANEGMRLFGELGKIEAGESLLRLVHAECLQATGAHERARDAIRAAREILLARVARIAGPTFRRSFLERIRENARTFELAREWAGEDERPWASPTILPE